MLMNWLFNLVCHVILLKRGRDNRLFATSTCGLEQPNRFCIVSNLNEQDCYMCDSRQPYQHRYNEQSHRVQNVIIDHDVRTREQAMMRWWQSDNAIENVSIQLNLEAEFHFTHLFLRFKTFRPAAMLIERSADYGRTWKVYRYYAHDCASAFPEIPVRLPRFHDDLVCTSEYSDITPSTGGEVVFKALPPFLAMSDPFAKEIQELLRITNLRINFTKLHTLGDELIDSRPETSQKYYYAVTSMIVRGSCSCYGHASRCVPEHPTQTRDKMVYGKCECTHHTKGRNCEECEDFYHDTPWRPAVFNETNECTRCECNRHATRCHFDESVYEQSYEKSGGVCDDCMHNTMGVHCEICKPFFYRLPEIPIDDASACRPCDCDLRGSENNGICDAETNEGKGLVAGRCRCKANVTGERCDICKDGYYELDENNSDGCKMCGCNRLGTVGNRGCDKYTGHCTCKRLVQQDEKCDKCLPNHYGLSEEPEGCKPCACHEGGSLGPECDEASGDCKCKPGFRGRDCSVPEDGYYCPLPDHYTYDAEDADFGGDKSKIVEREGSDRAWSGVGFVRVKDGDQIVFNTSNFSQSSSFKLVVWYESKLRRHWEDVSIAVVRPGHPSAEDCPNYTPSGDFGKTYFPPSRSPIGHVEVSNMDLCFEPKVNYQVKLIIGPQSRQPEEGAELLIDRIMLLPQVLLSDSSREQYERYRCEEYLLGLRHHSPPEECQRLFCVKGATMVDQAIDCECHKTGSISGVCEANGGQCQCRPNVIGRRCDECEPGSYGFSPSGCTECACDEKGSMGKTCDQLTGQCQCKPNIIGNRCDSCQPGYWGMPECRPCQCNGHASECDQKTGACINCMELTTGHYCERCQDKYYGDPRQGVDVPCKECPCPVGPVVGPIHADSCYAPNQHLPGQSEQVTCNCREGYVGERCDECDVNYWGNPKEVLGSCVKCSCNENIDWTVAESCHPTTGRCQKCSYNTAGEQCEICAEGYFGNALQRTCQMCACDANGHNSTEGPCDHVSGDCPCYENVTGKYCDQCRPNHYNITSGGGCSYCECDPEGVEADADGNPRLDCDLVSGQCHCRRERGGRACSECQSYYWGDPKVECKQCVCDRQGTAHYQCSKETGACVCREPYGGYSCDECARGFMGTFPDCRPCDPCFKQWDVIIEALHNETKALIRHAHNLRDKGALSAYDTEFDAMRKKLDAARTELDTANVTRAKLEELQMQIDSLNAQMQMQGKDSGDAGRNQTGETQDERLAKLSKGTELASRQGAELQGNAEELVDKAGALMHNVTTMRELDVTGAYDICRQSRDESARNAHEAMSKKVEIDTVMNEASRTKLMLQQNADKFKETYKKSVEELQVLNTNLSAMAEALPDMNHLVCGERTDECSVVCGGAGCGTCGRSDDANGVGGVCDWGSRTKATDTVRDAAENNKFFKKKVEETQAAVDKLKSMVERSEKHFGDASEVLDGSEALITGLDESEMEAAKLKNETEDLLGDTEDLTLELNALIENTTSTSLTVTEEMMKNLLDEMERVNEKIKSVGALTQDVRRNLSLANELKTRTADVKKQTDELLERKKKLEDDLENAQGVQDDQEAQLTEIEEIVDEVKDSNQNLKVLLTNVDSMIGVREANTSKLAGLTKVRQDFVENSANWQSINRTVEGTKEAQRDLNEKLKEATTEYKKAEELFNSKSEPSGQDTAQMLQEKASALVDTTSKNLNLLKEQEKRMEAVDIQKKKITADISSLLGRVATTSQKLERDVRVQQTCRCKGEQIPCPVDENLTPPQPLRQPSPARNEL